MSFKVAYMVVKKEKATTMIKSLYIPITLFIHIYFKIMMIQIVIIKFKT